MTQRYNNLTEQEQLELIQKDGILIRFISEPCEMVQIAAIKQCPIAIYYIAFKNILNIFKSAYALALALDPSIKNESWFKTINKDNLR